MEDGGEVVPFRVPEGVEVRHLRAFVAVAEELNFSRAAERLYISQPALSRQIRTLERVIGCDLLRRSTHSVELTLAGSALLDRARPVLAALDEAVAAAQSVGGELSARIMRLLAPVVAIATEQPSTQALREAFEAFLAETPMPPEIDVRAVTAGGVPGLALGDDLGVLYLHGGGYVLGSAYGYRPLVGALVEATGIGALIPDYRLAPEHSFPAALDDALAAYRWLVDRRGEAGRVVVAGDSSGAGLALALLLRLKEDGDAMPAATALLCPIVDLTGALLSPTIGPHLMDDLVRVAESYLDGHPIDDPLVSPLRGDLGGLPPLLVQTGEGDRARPEAEALAEEARRRGVAVRLELHASDVHVFHVFWSFLPEARDALTSAGEFIRASLALEDAASGSKG